MKKRMLPLRMHPSSWGKDGKDRELGLKQNTMLRMKKTKQELQK